jgi:hypothetical protein
LNTILARTSFEMVEQSRPIVRAIALNESPLSNPFLI